MFHKCICIECGKRNPIVYVDSIMTMGGTVKLRYCSDCREKRLKQDNERKEQNAKAFESERKEREKQKRYEYLKREIELRELEEKAKKLGIS